MRLQQPLNATANTTHTANYVVCKNLEHELHEP